MLQGLINYLHTHGIKLSGSNGLQAEVTNNKELVVNPAPLDKTIDSITAAVEDGFMDAGFDVVPSDTIDLTYPTTYLWVGASGDVKVDLLKGGTVTLKAVQAGKLHKIKAKRVYATGTTATGIVGAYHVV